MKRMILMTGLLALGGCGNEQNLHPPAGGALPPKAATSPTAPTATDLLSQPAAQRPSRSDELLTRSQPRTEDPFDLPPK